MAAFDFEKFFDEYVGATDKKWGHDRGKSLGASEAFGCIRKAFFKKSGAEEDPDYEQSWGALRRGDIIETAFVAPAMTWAMENLTKDAILLYAGEDQKTFIDGPLSATPDGLVIYADDDALAKYGIASLGGTECFNLEIKSIDPRVNLKEEKAIHRGQTIVQMGLTRRKTQWRPNFAVILYVDCSFLDDIEVFIVPYDDKTYKVAEARAKTVFETKNAADLMAEGKIDGSCDFCPFKRACSAATQSRTPGKEAGEANHKNTPLAIMEDFERLIMAERAASRAKKAAEKEQKEASERLKAWFRETGVRVALAEDGKTKCSISWIKGRKTLDKSLLIADGINPEDYMREGDGHDRLNISEKGSSKDEGDEDG